MKTSLGVNPNTRAEITADLDERGWLELEEYEETMILSPAQVQKLKELLSKH